VLGDQALPFFEDAQGQHARGRGRHLHVDAVKVHAAVQALGHIAADRLAVHAEAGARQVERDLGFLEALGDKAPAEADVPPLHRLHEAVLQCGQADAGVIEVFEAQEVLRVLGAQVDRAQVALLIEGVHLAHRPGVLGDLAVVAEGLRLGSREDRAEKAGGSVVIGPR